MKSRLARKWRYVSVKSENEVQRVLKVNRRLMSLVVYLREGISSGKGTALLYSIFFAGFFFQNFRRRKTELTSKTAGKSQKDNQDKSK